ncbi:MAG: hypothetical protein HZA36_00135 [Parcubacteria group bacterium]|nr:hypothetical protein [Parcubacteria group bacterium]
MEGKENDLHGPFYMGTMFQSMEDSPDAHTLTYEVWENKHPENLEGGQMIPFHVDLFSSEQLDKLIPFWKSFGEKLFDPILSIQGDIGKGVVRSYQYQDKRKQVPPNATGHIIKPIFDSIILDTCTIDFGGKSLIYHTSLLSTTLRSEIEKFNQLLFRFFSGEDLFKTLNRPVTFFHHEIVVSKEDLDKMC